MQKATSHAAQQGDYAALDITPKWVDHHILAPTNPSSRSMATITHPESGCKTIRRMNQVSSRKLHRTPIRAPLQSSLRRNPLIGRQLPRPGFAFSPGKRSAQNGTPIRGAAAAGAGARTGPVAGVEGCAQLVVPLPPNPAVRRLDRCAVAGPGGPGPHRVGTPLGGDDPGAAVGLAHGADLPRLGLAPGPVPGGAAGRIRHRRGRAGVLEPPGHGGTGAGWNAKAGAQRAGVPAARGPAQGAGGAGRLHPGAPAAARCPWC